MGPFFSVRIEEKYINNILLKIKNKTTTLIRNKVSFCKSYARKTQRKPISRAAEPLRLKGYWTYCVVGSMWQLQAIRQITAHSLKYLDLSHLGVGGEVVI